VKKSARTVDGRGGRARSRTTRRATAARPPPSAQSRAGSWPRSWPEPPCRTPARRHRSRCRLTSGERLTIAPKAKSQKAGLSMTFTGTPRARAAAANCAAVAVVRERADRYCGAGEVVGRDVAAVDRDARRAAGFARAPPAHRPVLPRIPPHEPRPPDSNSAFQAACALPPATTARLPSRVGIPAAAPVRLCAAAEGRFGRRGAVIGASLCLDVARSSRAVNRPRRAWQQILCRPCSPDGAQRNPGSAHPGLRCAPSGLQGCV